MKKVKIIENVFLDIPDASIGVLVSGGVDSALLLYFLLKNVEKEIHIFSLASQEKKLTNIKTSMDVISKCSELTENYNFIHHIKYEKQQKVENLLYLPLLYLNNNVIEFLYTGVTKNPPNEILKTFKGYIPEDDKKERDPTIVRTVQSGKFFTPWTNLNKKEIFQIYQKYNLLETLFPITRSCEWFSKLNYPDPGQGHCGKCWWCEEREWGFGRL